MAASEFIHNFQFITHESTNDEYLWKLEAIAHVVASDSRFFWNGYTFEWEGKEKDWSMLQEVFQLLLQTKEVSDLDFQPSMPQIMDQLKATGLMQMLDDPQIKVSASQNGNTPFQHTREVLQKLNSDALVDFLLTRVEDVGLIRVIIRLLAIIHDIGKIFGAVGKESMYHPFISALLMREFLESYVELSDDVVEVILFVVQYHHVYEEIAWGRIQETEFVRRFSNNLVALLLHTLSKADVPVPALQAENEVRFRQIRDDLQFI